MENNDNDGLGGGSNCDAIAMHNKRVWMVVEIMMWIQWRTKMVEIKMQMNKIGVDRLVVMIMMWTENNYSSGRWAVVEIMMYVNEALFYTGVTTLFRDPEGGLALVPLITI